MEVADPIVAMATARCVGNGVITMSLNALTGGSYGFREAALYSCFPPLSAATQCCILQKAIFCNRCLQQLCTAQGVITT